MKIRYIYQISAGLILYAVYCGLIILRVGFDQTLLTLALTPAIVLTLSLNKITSKERYLRYYSFFLLGLFVITSTMILRLLFL